MLTEPFERVLANVLTYWRPDRSFPVIALSHPIQNVTEAELAAKAAALASAVLPYLPDGPESGGASSALERK